MSENFTALREFARCLSFVGTAMDTVRQVFGDLFFG
jgi:hypothetical protein